MWQFLSSLVPSVGSVVFFALVFGFIIMLRWFRHREVMAQIEQGLLPEDHRRETGNDRTLRKLLGWGLGLAALGLALLIGLYPFGFVVQEPWPLHFGPWMVVGLVPLFIGLALLITYYASRDKRAPQEAEEAQREQAEA